MRKLSPRRRTTRAHDLNGLAEEQLQHFGIDEESAFGQTLVRLARRLYEAQDDVEQLWALTAQTIQKLDRSDRIAYFNAKKFLSFQLAKLLDTLQNPNRRSYQALGYSPSTVAAKGPIDRLDRDGSIDRQRLQCQWKCDRAAKRKNGKLGRKRRRRRLGHRARSVYQLGVRFACG